MSENVVINGTTYNGVDALSLVRADGTVVTFYPDAVRYNAQNLTEAQKAQARQNIGAQAELTEADKEAIVQQVIAALGTPVFGTVDADKNIVLSTPSPLANGTYTFWLEGEDGKLAELCTIALGGIENLADPTSADWVANKRLNSSGELSNAYAVGNGGAVTNYIPCKQGDVIRVKGLDVSHYYTSAQGELARTTAFFYSESKTIIAKNIPADGNGWVYANGIWTYPVGTGLTAVSGSNSDIRYARLTGVYYSGYTANDVIITVNEEIE